MGCTNSNSKSEIKPTTAARTAHSSGPKANISSKNGVMLSEAHNIHLI